MMRVSKALGSWFGRGVAMAAALVALSTATDARADAEFTATGGKGSIEVKGNPPLAHQQGSPVEGHGRRHHARQGQVGAHARALPR